MMIGPRVFISLLLAILLSGCAFTRMETANQLEGGDVVLSGSLDNIGFGPIPRANFTAMRGFRDSGDLSVHLGTTLFSANAGLGTRFYLTDRFNLSLQGDVMTVLVNLPFSPQSRFERFIVTGVPRLTTAVKGDEFFYGGIQANVLTGLQPGQTELLGAVGGLVIGMDFGSKRDGGGIQGELILYPIQYQDGRVSFFADLNEPQVLLFQFSIGVYLW